MELWHVVLHVSTFHISYRTGSADVLVHLDISTEMCYSCIQAVGPLLRPKWIRRWHETAVRYETKVLNPLSRLNSIKLISETCCRKGRLKRSGRPSHSSCLLHAKVVRLPFSEWWEFCTVTTAMSGRKQQVDSWDHYARCRHKTFLIGQWTLKYPITDDFRAFRDKQINNGRTVK